jgi:predicted RecA/RadA family phage recombinase
MAGGTVKKEQKDMATKHSEGLRIDYTPVGAVTAGTVIVQEDLIGIATADIAAGVLGTIDIEGVFTVKKLTGSGEDISIGEIVYWNVAGSGVTTEPSDNVYMGKAISNADEDDTTVGVKLTP